jgi:hypothetical protein
MAAARPSPHSPRPDGLLLGGVGRLRSDLARGIRMSTAQAQKAKHKAKAPRHHNNGKSPSPEKITQSLVAAVVDQVAAVFSPEK